MELRRTAVLLAVVSATTCVFAAGASASRERTVTNLVAPLVAQAHTQVTLDGSVSTVTAGSVVILGRSSPAGRWKTLGRTALRSGGKFVFKTRVGATGAHGVRHAYFRAVYAGDATHLPSHQDCVTQVV
jgi:hypothetical protein